MTHSSVTRRLSAQEWTDVFNNWPGSIAVPIGQTIGVNHTACGDRRGRLRVTSAPDGFVAFCHNCGSAGYWAAPPAVERANTLPTWPQTANDVLDVIRASVPCESGVRGWYWLTSFNIPEKMLLTYGFRYNAELDSVLIPCGNMAVASSDGVFADFLPESMPIWVARRLSRRVGDKKTPKYVTIRLKDSSPTCVLICKGIANEKTASRPVVIVEDVLSALKLAAAGFDGLALCGVSLRADEHLHAIKSHPVVIWFDNDNKQVLDRARLCRDAVIAARTGLEHGYPITMITPDLYVGDPKSASYSTINELVNGVLERA